MNAVYDAARKYSGKGWSVIPIAANQKKPAVKWVQDGYAEKRPSFLDLQGWFAGQEKNLAIITGKVSGLLVVDIDNPELFDEYRAKYPTGLIAQTPKGGYHLYYKYDGDDIGNSVSRLQSGIDVRCRHGYVLAAPSHVKYEDGREGDYKWLSEGEATPLPDELRERILADLKLQYTQNGQAELTANQEDGHSLWVRVLSSGFTSGKHNQEAKDCARYLFRQGMNEDAIINTLASINAKDPTPLPAHELIATVKSGVGYERNRLAKKETAPGSNTFEVLSEAELFERYEDYEEKWLIKDWIPDESILMVSAPPEKYKTWLLLDAAISLAIGNNETDFLGVPIETEPIPVLIVQQEDNWARLRQRIGIIKYAKLKHRFKPLSVNDVMTNPTLLDFGYLPYNEMPIYYHVDRKLSLDNAESVAGLEQVIAEKKIKLVLVDPFYTLTTADDFFASAAQKLAPIRELRDKYHTAFIFAHHDRKSGGQGRSSRYGSVLLDAATEGGWGIKSDEDTGQLFIERYGKVFPGVMPSMTLKFDINTDPENGPLRYGVELGEPVTALKPAAERKYTNAIVEFVMSNAYVTQKAIAEALGIKAGAVSREVARLKKEGRISDKDGRLYVPVQLPDGM